MKRAIKETSNVKHTTHMVITYIRSVITVQSCIVTCVSKKILSVQYR